MKKFISIFAMAQMIIWSCVKPEIDSPAIVTPDPEDVVFSAIVETTKATPAAGGVVTWTMDDQIGVYDGTNYVKATVLSVEGNKITFSASVNPSADKYIAVSPYQMALTDNGKFTKDGENVKLATSASVQTAGQQVVSVAAVASSTETFAFKNVGNLLRFKVNKAAVKQVKITGAAGTEKIAGVVSVNPATGVAKGTLTETTITASVTPGVDNFIALAPGVELPEGFVITLYGEQLSDAGYEGEVSSAAAINFTGDNSRNKMLNLGTIDGWIDNYKLWQAGKSITIAGVEYTKASTGLEGALISAKDADVDLANRLSDGRLDAKAYFLETSGTFKITTPNWYNVGNSTNNSTVLFISRYDNMKARLNPSTRIVLVNGNFAAKGIDFEISNSSSAYYFQGYTQADFGNFHLDACNLALDKGDKILYFYTNGSNDYKAVKSIKIVNSKIKSRSSDATKVDLVYASSAYKYLDKWDEFIFQNNVLYNTTANGTVCLLNASGSTSSTIPKTILKVENNTFYNMHGSTQYFIGYSLGSLSFKGNLLYSTEIPVNDKGTKLTTYFAQTSETTFKYPYTFENNATNYAIYYFNINQPGVYGKDSPDKVSTFIKAVANATSSTFFSKADTENGIFIPTDAYASYGAKQ